jgi:hypothetical protein
MALGKTVSCFSGRTMMKKVYMLMACCLLVSLVGCGGESGDPTARITELKAVPDTVTPGGSAVITATVIKAGGTTTTATATTTIEATTSSAWGVNITFKLLTANGAHLSTLTQQTDGDGKASIVYTAGNNYNQDVIQATLENENSASLIIKKTGIVPGRSIIITDPSTSPSVKANGYVSITAQVTDNSSGSEQPISGETVEFKLIENGSGASVKVQSAVTDAAGKATALYQAGGKHPATDVVQAKLLSNGSASTVIITVAGSAPGPVISSMTTDRGTAPSIKAGQQCIITIKVTDGSTASPVSGELVNFQINPNNSGSSLIIPNPYTDAQGQVVVIFIGGVQSPSSAVTDTVQARVVSSGSSNSVVITVNP